MAAMATGLELLAISGEEAEILASGVQGLMAEYGFEATGKMAAWLTMLGAVGIVYGPRVLHVRAMRQKAIAEQQAAHMAAMAGDFRV